MYLKILAFDLDGTLAHDGHVAPDVWQALRRARQKGFTLMLVTGRTLATFEADGPFAEVFEAIVAENGAAVYFTKLDSVLLPFGRLERDVIRRLERRRVPLERGVAIVATRQPYDEIVDDVLRETGRSASVEYNKGAAMVMPPGATKGAGLRYALQELGYSEHNVLAGGDAENDRSLFEIAEYAVAANGATPDIQELADFVIDGRYPEGICGFIDALLSGTLPASKKISKHRFAIGRHPDGTLVYLEPSTLVNGNTAIIGSSASGKSWLAGLIGEQLLQKGYQVCIIDPEGDYTTLRAFPHTLLLGGEASRLPNAVDVLTLSEYSNVSLVLDLSMYDLDRRAEYVQDLLQGLLVLRARRGRPHWFLIDEIHSFCPPEGGPLTDLIVRGMNEGGLGVVSFRPTLVSRQILEMVNAWFLTRIQLPEEIALLETLIPGCPNWEDLIGLLPTLPVGDVYFLQGACEGLLRSTEVESFRADGRMVPHVRHLHKYLRAPLPTPKRFYFSNENGGRTAASLWEFREAMDDISTSTLQYHLDRGDFERWLKDVLHDDELARRLRKIKHRRPRNEELRQALVLAVGDRYEELESLI